MVHVDPAQAFKGQLLFAAPHMDDEVLACGGTIARLPLKQQVHVVYASDGARSPRPVYPWQGKSHPGLPKQRLSEAQKALAVLGVPEANAHFLGLPDGHLKACIDPLIRALVELIDSLRPSYLFIPFRYDRHPDHLALNWAAKKAVLQAEAAPTLIEYFVYYRWRLLPGGDVRKYIHPDQLMQVNIEGCTLNKKKALRCYESQTTRFYEWQERAILPPERVDEVSSQPELFLKISPEYQGAPLFARYKTWIRLAHTLEPFIKNKKEQTQALFRRRPLNHAR